MTSSYTSPQGSLLFSLINLFSASQAHNMNSHLRAFVLEMLFLYVSVWFTFSHSHLSSNVRPPPSADPNPHSISRTPGSEPETWSTSEHSGRFTCVPCGQSSLSHLNQLFLFTRQSASRGEALGLIHVAALMVPSCPSSAAGL